jgi:hypothetical protein
VLDQYGMKLMKVQINQKPNAVMTEIVKKCRLIVTPEEWRRK